MARAIAATTSIALFTSLPFLFHEFCKQSWWVSTLPKLSSHVARLRLNARGDDVGLVLKLDGLEPDVQGVVERRHAERPLDVAVGVGSARGSPTLAVGRQPSAIAPGLKLFTRRYIEEIRRA